MTIAERWLADGEAKGRVEGEAKGRVEGKAEVLRRLLVLKFGPVAEEILAVIAAANEGMLAGWVERVLTATTVAAVFGAE